MRRKEIDNFLIELDKFIFKNKDKISENELIELLLPFKVGKPSTFGVKDSIPFLILVQLINKPQVNKYKTDPKTRRTDNYLRRVAYKLEYIYVKGESYYEVFSKILKHNKNFKLEGLKLIDFYKKDYGKKILILKDYGKIDLDLYFKGDYEVGRVI